MNNKKFNDKTMCFEYPNGKVKETYEEKFDRELLISKWKMRSCEISRNDMLKMMKGLILKEDE